ncbi:MAG TPA: signal peptidase I, partial [Nocardioidaceae bacterium]|nr:signal peptidase I [Nocardioidaceae bacterium]
MTHVPDHDVSTGTTQPVPPSRRGRRREQLPIWQEMVLLLAIALVLAIVIKAFLMQAFYIPSASMDPTLKVNDRVLVNKLSYRLHGVHRGDIVVFKAPPGESSEN